jgi:hypothetical protein
MKNSKEKLRMETVTDLRPWLFEEQGIFFSAFGLKTTSSCASSIHITNSTCFTLVSQYQCPQSPILTCLTSHFTIAVAHMPNYQHNDAEHAA